MSEPAAPPAGCLGQTREPSGSTCGLISSPTWESAHSFNERGKEKKTFCRCQPGLALQTCTAAPCFGTVTQSPHAAQCAAAGPRHARGRAAGTVRLGRPETSIVPPPLAAPLFLPPAQAFFISSPPLLQVSFLSLLPSSFLLSLSLIILEG